MNEHTPGPWALVEETPEHSEIVAGGRLILSVISENVAIDTEGKANARLIAAAPRHLAALEDVVSSEYDLQRMSVETLETLREIRAGLASPQESEEE